MSLKDNIVLITGASSGIGRSCARVFAREGARPILAARRIDRLRELAGEIHEAHGVESLCVALDVRNRDDVQAALSGLPPEWSSIEILLNNAGLSRGLSSLQDGEIEDWEEMIDTNVKGLLYVTRAVLPGMVARGSGHVVNIGSIAGREVYAKGNVYCATKYAVRALTQGMRVDLHGTPVRVSTVDPGLVQTEFSEVRFHGDRERARKVYEGAVPLTPDDIAEAVLFCATRPPHVTVAELVILASDQSSATQVFRRTR
jgi:3-hydroxy acid dehydrogenase/malonic semialdehyde reductase